MPTPSFSGVARPVLTFRFPKISPRELVFPAFFFFLSIKPLYSLPDSCYCPWAPVLPSIGSRIPYPLKLPPCDCGLPPFSRASNGPLAQSFSGGIIKNDFGNGASPRARQSCFHPFPPFNYCLFGMCFFPTSVIIVLDLSSSPLSTCPQNLRHYMKPLMPDSITSNRCPLLTAPVDFPPRTSSLYFPPPHKPAIRDCLSRSF